MIKTPINNTPYPSYVIHVKEGYEDRERSIVSQFGHLSLPFEWIKEYDIKELNKGILSRYQYHGSELRPSEISCSLKHITAWERIATHHNNGAMVFEDDILFNNPGTFQQQIKKALAELHATGQDASYISLGDGCAMYVPWTSLSKSRCLYAAEQVRAADSYFLSQPAARLMVEAVRQQGFFLPADHLINKLCHELGIAIHWLSPTIISQGSHTGRFASAIQPQDKGRLLEKAKWVAKKIRRKYLFPLLGIDLRKLSPELKNDLEISKSLLVTEKHDAAI